MVGSVAEVGTACGALGGAPVYSGGPRVSWERSEQDRGLVVPGVTKIPQNHHARGWGMRQRDEAPGQSTCVHFSEALTESLFSLSCP